MDALSISFPPRRKADLRAGQPRAFNEGTVENHDDKNMILA